MRSSHLRFRVASAVGLALAFLLATSSVLAQSATAVVRRNVNLRRDPSTGAPPIRLLQPGMSLHVLSEETSNDYYEVRTAAGEEGWVYARNVALVESAPGEESETEPEDVPPGPIVAVPAEPHEERFQLSRSFITDVWHYPDKPLDVTFGCAGPVHDPEHDCEIHASALLADPLISDFQSIVLEPPNVCQRPPAPGKAWRTELNKLSNSPCTASGIIRVWPEHLTNGQGCSNPEHFMEMHPLLKLDCGGTQYDFTEYLYAFHGLGYKTPERVLEMLTFRLWVCPDCSGDVATGELPATISFDYCVGEPCRASAVSNFARFKVRLIPKLIRTTPGFTTAIARVTPVDENGATPHPSWPLLKLYAMPGSSAHDAFLAASQNPTVQAPMLDVIAMFMVDPLSVIKTIEAATTQRGQWTEVAYPVAAVIFGQLE